MDCHFRNTDDDVLSTQIDVYNEGSTLDQKETEDGMDITDHTAVFRAVYAKVSSPQSANS